MLVLVGVLEVTFTDAADRKKGVSILVKVYICLLIAFAPSKNDKQLCKEHMQKYTLQRIIHLRSNLTLLTNYDYKDTHNFVFLCFV